MSEHWIPSRIVGAAGWKIYHKPKWKSYAYGSVESAMDRAVRLGRIGMDWDRRVSADGTGWWCHQANPTHRDAWVDPKGEITDADEIANLHDEDIARLRFKGEPIMDDETALKEFKKRGLIPMVETKPYRLSKEHWQGFKALADRIGVVPVIASLPSRAFTKLQPPHEAGLVTLLLWRTGADIPPFVDLVKSHGGRNIYRVSNRPIGDGPRPPRPRYNPRLWQQLGAPVKHPFAPRTRRWKRQHPKTWVRIVRFRRAWRRDR